MNVERIRSARTALLAAAVLAAALGAPLAAGGLPAERPGAARALACEAATFPAFTDPPGAHVIVGDAGAPQLDDRIFGGDAYDTIHGFQGNDCLYGEAGADWIGGYDGDDRVQGGLGADTLYGGDGNDTVVGDAAKPIPQKTPPTNVDLVDGGEGDDVLSGGYGPDELYGGPGTDVCNGGPDGDGADEPVGPKTDWKDKYYGCETVKE